jgi:hypothetical protein
LSKSKNGKKKKYRKAHEVSLFDTNIIIFKLSHFQIFKLKNYLRFSKRQRDERRKDNRQSII